MHDEPLPTQSKMTRARAATERQVQFLQEGKSLRLGNQWPKKKRSKEEPYPIIIRKKFRSINEYRRVICASRA